MATAGIAAARYGPLPDVAPIVTIDGQEHVLTRVPLADLAEWRDAHHLQFVRALGGWPPGILYRKIERDAHKR